jgi:hypothetical protein
LYVKKCEQQYRILGKSYIRNKLKEKGLELPIFEKNKKMKKKPKP